MKKEIKSLSEFIADLVASSIRWGKVQVAPEVKEARRKICNGCEKKCEHKCTACGCYIEYKIPFAVSKCPLKKW